MTSSKRGSQRKRFRIRITLTVSVTLMLLILGLVALTLVAGRNVSRDIHEQAGFVAVLTESTTQAQSDSLRRAIAAHPYCAHAQYVSADEVLDRWHRMMGDDSKLPDINPFLPEIEVAVREQWANSDSLTLITSNLKTSPAISEISLHTDVVNSVNSFIHTASLALIIVGAVMLLISLALINNTVRLTVYSQRFLINTMKLVGATSSFIRKPFVADAMAHGAIAGAIASAMLCGVTLYLRNQYLSVSAALPLWQVGCVLGGTFLSGILLCTVASWLATGKYLRLGYDDMFK